MTFDSPLVIVTPEFSSTGGGIATYYRNLVTALSAKGVRGVVVEAHAFTPPADVDIAPGWRLMALDRDRIESTRQSFTHLEAMPRLRRELAVAWTAHHLVRDLGNPILVEATDYGLLALPFVIDPVGPVVMQCHASIGQIGLHDSVKGTETEEAMFLALETACASLAGACQTYSEANAGYWRSQTGREITCLYPSWTPYAVTESTTQDRITIFGRIQRWKGPHIVCEALDLLGGVKTPQFEWYGRDVAISSDGETTGDWLRTNYASTWESKIVPKGPVSPSEVAAIQASSRFNLIPSTWDVFNFTAVEAMASGRPVICSDKAGASELIKDGVTGFIYAGDRPDELATTLQRALATTETRLIEIGQAARAHIEAALDPTKIASERIRAYEALGAVCKLQKANIPDWIKLIALPRSPGEDSQEFLMQTPIRSLINNIRLRTLRKLGGRR